MPGSTCGHRSVVSPAFSLVTGSGFPPAEEIRTRPVLPSCGAVMMLPSSPQLAPRFLIVSLLGGLVQ